MAFSFHSHNVSYLVIDGVLAWRMVGGQNPAAKKTGSQSDDLASQLLPLRRHYWQGLHYLCFANIFSSTRERRLINEDLT